MAAPLWRITPSIQKNRDEAGFHVSENAALLGNSPFYQERFRFLRHHQNSEA
jgi:hypothetical protein